MKRRGFLTSIASLAAMPFVPFSASPTPADYILAQDAHVGQIYRRNDELMLVFKVDGYEAHVIRGYAGTLVRNKPGRITLLGRSTCH